MARRDVVEVTCDRCGRVETQSSGDAPKIEGGKGEVSITFHGEAHSFEDLCKRCRSAVKGYFDRIAKKVDDQEPAPSNNVTPIDPATPPKKRFLGGK